MGEASACGMLVGWPLRKRPFVRPRKRNDNININLTEIAYDNGECMELAQERVRWRWWIIGFCYQSIIHTELFPCQTRVVTFYFKENTEIWDGPWIGYPSVFALITPLNWQLSVLCIIICNATGFQYTAVSYRVPSVHQIQKHKSYVKIENRASLVLTFWLICQMVLF